MGLEGGTQPWCAARGFRRAVFFGSFDGKTFKVIDAPGAHGWTNYGKDDYCAISYNGIPSEEKPVLIGWMSNWQYAAKLPTSPWRGQMSLPRRLSLVHDGAGLSLKQEPVVAPLQTDRKSITAAADAASPARTITTQQSPYELDLAFSSHPGQIFGLRLYSDDAHWTEIGFDRRQGEFYIDRTKASQAVAAEFPARTAAPLMPARPFDLKLIVDGSSVEAYVQGGTIAMTDLVYPVSPKSRVELFSSGGGKVDVTGQSWSLRSVWSGR